MKTLLATLVFATNLCWISNDSHADLIYNIAPQQLINDGNGQMEAISGGTMTMVDGADADGLLMPNELLSMIVFNSMGENGVTQWDSSDTEGGVYFNSLTFQNGQLVGRLELQDMSQDSAWIKYGTDFGFENSLFMFSGFHKNEYATGTWNSPYIIATSNAVPEPASIAILTSCLIGFSTFRLRRRR